MKPTILSDIFTAKKRRVYEKEQSCDFDALRLQAFATRGISKRFRLQDALAPRSVNIIAEIKRASPSRGSLRNLPDVTELAMAYLRGGACAISVLTEEDYFMGSIDDLLAVRSRVDTPLLQKDFIFCEFQIYEAAASGADAVLLIVAMLDDESLFRLYRTAETLGLDALVEVHDETELARAVALGAKVIGINNRNLHTFEVSLDVSKRLGAFMPTARFVSESGISTRSEIRELAAAGFSGFLIGETLMRSDDPQNTLGGLINND